MRKQVFAIASVILLLGSASAAVAADPPRHWLRQTNGPVVVTIIDNTGDGLWQSAVRDAAAEWNAGVDHVEFVHTIAAGDCEGGEGPLTVVVCVHTTEPRYAAVTRYRSGPDGHLWDVTIWMAPKSRPDRVRLSCHELGHALGLEHRTEKKTTSCMTAAGPGGAHPDQKDFQTVTNAHAHAHP